MLVEIRSSSAYVIRSVYELKEVETIIEDVDLKNYVLILARGRYKRFA